MIDEHGAFLPVEAEKLALVVVVMVAAQYYLEVRIIVHGPEKVGKLAAIFVVVEPAGGKRALGRRIGAGHNVNAGEQVNEQVARQTGPVILVAAPPEKSRRIEGALGSTVEPGVPVDGLLAGVRRNRIYPGPAVGVPVPR